MSDLKKPIIAVDLDDVLAAHAEEFIKFSNEQFGTNLTLKDYREDWSEIWLMSLEEMWERVELWRSPNRVDNFKKLPDEDLDTVLEVLKERFDLVIVTARPSIWHDSTVEWIGRHYPDTFKDIRLVPIWTKETRQTKAEVCREIGAEYLIDDSVRHCNIAAEAGITALLFESYSWNEKTQPHKEVVRVKGWREVKEYFDARS